MKHLIFSLCAISLATNAAHSDISLNFDTIPNDNILIVSQNPIRTMLTARTEEDLQLSVDTIFIDPENPIIPVNINEPQRYTVKIPAWGNSSMQFYLQPSENLKIDIIGNSSETFDYTITGTPLMDGITRISNDAKPFEDILIAIQQGRNTSDNFDEVYKKYLNIFTSYIDNNKDNPAAVFALLNTTGETFLNYYSQLGENAKTSILFPFAERQKATIERQVESERRQKELESGNVIAPEFSLPDEKGNIVNLCNYRGKWVVLDFWGSWCGWCIKGFPKMKEAYAKFADKAEFIGIDCGDSREKWLNALAKYELPWVNLYNDTESNIENRPDQSYSIQGYPTKVIISPEGKIVKIVTGEDPQFYSDLDNLIK